MAQIGVIGLGVQEQKQKFRFIMQDMVPTSTDLKKWHRFTLVFDNLIL